VPTGIVGHGRVHVISPLDHLTGQSCRLLDVVEHVANAVAHNAAAESAGTRQTALDSLNRVGAQAALGSRPDRLDRWGFAADLGADPLSQIVKLLADARLQQPSSTAMGRGAAEADTDPHCSASNRIVAAEQRADTADGATNKWGGDHGIGLFDLFVGIGLLMFASRTGSAAQGVTDTATG
jgi:hypothetical protein